MNGSTGVEVPHEVIKSGGDGKAGITVRSKIFAPENLVCLNNTNRTDAQCWADAGGFTWNTVDFNTTNTEGADVGITGALSLFEKSSSSASLTWNSSTRSFLLADNTNWILGTTSRSRGIQYSSKD